LGYSFWLALHDPNDRATPNFIAIGASAVPKITPLISFNYLQCFANTITAAAKATRSPAAIKA
jgi:hypothetical protein